MLRPKNGIRAVLASAAVLSVGISSALAQTPTPRQPSPCEKITIACQAAGFVQGGGAEGKGLWKDCVTPLLFGPARPASAKPLPIIDPQLKAACLAAQPNFGKPRSEPPATKPTLSYTPSAPTIFMTQQELWRYRFQWGPSDGPFGAIPLGQGRYRFLGTGGGGRQCPPAARKTGVFSFTGTLDRVTGGDGCGILFGSGDGPAGWLFNANYSGGGQLLRFAAQGKSGWLMTFRGEYQWKNPARADGLCEGGGAAFAGGVPCYYSTLGLAVSTDGARTFRVAGESLQLTDPLSASKGGSVNRNIGYGSLLVADANGMHLDNPPPDPKNAYIYLVFVSSGKDLPGRCSLAQCPGIARAPYEAVVSAVLSGNPHAVARLFRKYDAESKDPWSQPATGDSPDLSIGGGKFSPLYQGPGFHMVVYDRAFDVYLGATTTYTGPVPGLTIRTSTDLIHWSDPIGPPITDGRRALSYVTLLGETGDPDVAGVEPRLYFRSTAEGKATWQDSVFKVVTLKLARN
jgi:hypothetical protein